LSIAKPSDLASGAVKDVVQRPSLFAIVHDIMSLHFIDISTADLVSLALCSSNCTKFVLSQLVPLIIDGNIRAYEVIQRISAAGKRGEPAPVVVDLFQQQQGITCLMIGSIFSTSVEPLMRNDFTNINNCF
jgi:hypothetical protein